MSYRSDCELLGLDPSNFDHDPVVVKEKFRELALKLHPDHVQGMEDGFVRAREAYKRVYSRACEEWLKCPTCKGEKGSTTTVGFCSVFQRCAACGGSGKR